MGGCATKPKVSKDDPDAKVKAPEPEPEPEPQPPKVDAVDGTKVPQEPPQPQPVKSVDEIKVPQEPQPEMNTVVDDAQTNNRRSLSLLFNKENDDTKVSTENEKTGEEETVKQETLEAQKPLEDSKSNEPIVKQESSKLEENKLVNNEPAKQESPPIELEEKSSVQNESNKPAEELAKLESKVEKLLEKNQINEPLKQEFVDAKDTPLVETENKEPIKQEPLLESTNIEQLEAGKPSNGSKDEKPETLIEETTKVAPQPEEKVIEALLIDAGSVPKITTEEATFSSREEKNHNEVETENKEPIKQEPLLESTNVEQLEAGKPSSGSKDEKPKTLIEETTKVAPQPEEKVIEALLTDAGSVPKITKEEATFSSREEKNQNEVEHPSKAGDTDNIKT